MVTFSHDTKPEEEDENRTDYSTRAVSVYWRAPTTESSGLSGPIAFCFTLNTCVGTGFLTIPWAFVQGGILASFLLLAVSCVFMDTVKDYLVVSMARAENMLNENLHWVKIHKEEEAPADEETTLVDPNVKQYNEEEFQNEPPQKEAEQERYLMKKRKFEINMMCRLFVGKWLSHLYTVCYALYAYGALWAYTSVFASALGENNPIITDNDDLNYDVYVLIFACIVVPLACLELHEQVPVQIFMTVCRFLMMILMSATAKLCAEDNDVTSADAAPMFDFAGLYVCFPIIVFAQIFHPTIPVLSHPIRDKKIVGGMLRVAILCINALYASVGLFVASAFGSAINQSANLNWEIFHAGTGTVQADGTIVGAALWTQIIAKYIVLFPALDVMSAFPLNAIALGNSLLGFAFGTKVHEAEKSRTIVTSFRLLAAVPPLLMSIAVKELGEITSLTGVVALLVAFCFPSILFIESGRIAKERGFSTITYYTSYGCVDFLAWFLIGFGIVTFIFSVVQNLMAL